MLFAAFLHASGACLLFSVLYFIVFLFLFLLFILLCFFQYYIQPTKTTTTQRCAPLQKFCLARALLLFPSAKPRSYSTGGGYEGLRSDYSILGPAGCAKRLKSAQGLRPARRVRLIGPASFWFVMQELLCRVLFGKLEEQKKKNYWGVDHLRKKACKKPMTF